MDADSSVSAHVVVAALSAPRSRPPPARPRRRPRAGRLPAAGALRPSLGPTDAPVSRSVSPPPAASHPRVGAGKASRPRPGDPATDPHTAHGTRTQAPCPPLAAFAAKHLRPGRDSERLRHARLRRFRVQPDISGPLPSHCVYTMILACTFRSPPFRFCSLCSACCLGSSAR